MTAHRERSIKDSNNTVNPEKNLCALAVAQCLGVQNNKRYLHTIQDLIRASRKDWLVRSRKSSLKCSSIAELQQSIAKKGDAMYYIVIVPGHVCLMDSSGRRIVDTASSYTLKHAPTHVYGVYDL